MGVHWGSLGATFHNFGGAFGGSAAEAGRVEYAESADTDLIPVTPGYPCGGQRIFLAW